jgi:hypothetical protein
MTGSRPQTIQIFLPDGNPTSIRIADITNRMITAVLIPRSKLGDVAARQEVRRYGIYFLFGENEEKAKPITYIGETDDCFIRLQSHNRAKEFWNYAVVISSKSNNFTKGHVKYLEYLCIKSAIEIGRYDTENQVSPARPHVTESMEADLMDNYETIKVLLSTLGFPVLEEMRKVAAKSKEILYCKGKDASAEGDMLDDGFAVFKGSTANLNEAKSINQWITGLRKKLIDSKVLVQENGTYLFTQDYLFASPSAAAATILARAANGWNEWKNSEGKSIDELYRAEVEEVN